MPSKKKPSRAKTSRKKAKPKPAKPEEPRPTRVPLKTYDITQRTHERRAVLQKDTETWGTLKILKQLNQAREAQQWNPRVHDIITKDLEYLEKAYQRERQN
jgi:hypothetical protein